MATNPTCTITVSADGRKCGEPAQYSGTLSDGSPWGTCAEHTTPADIRAAAGRRSGDPEVGDHVPVYRNGKTYDGVVTYVGPRGGVRAKFTYNNGGTCEVRV